MFYQKIKGFSCVEDWHGHTYKEIFDVATAIVIRIFFHEFYELRIFVDIKPRVGLISINTFES